MKRVAKSMKDINTYAASQILKNLDDIDIINFGYCFPEQHEAVSNHWNTHHVINVDETEYERPSALCKVLKRCIKLKTFTLTKKRFGLKFYNILQIIESLNPRIKVLNITGSCLYIHYITKLSKFHFLRSLSLECEILYNSGLGEAFKNIPRLKELYLTCTGGPSNNKGSCFLKLPRSLEVLILRLSEFNTVNLVQAMKKWNLKRFHLLDFPINFEVMEQLSKFRNLTSLHVRYDHPNDFILRTLFENNPGLVDFTILSSEGIERGAMFQYLPLSLNSLNLSTNVKFSQTNLLTRLKRLDLTTFTLRRPFYNTEDEQQYDANFVTNLVQVAPNLHHLSLIMNNEAMHFEALGELDKLKTFSLCTNENTNINNILQVISQRCLKIEELNLIKTFNLNEQGMEYIVRLPKLNTIQFGKDLFNSQCMRILSTCATLETVKFKHCRTHIDTFALILIEHCKSLKLLETSVAALADFNVDQFLLKTIDILSQQTDRKDILNIIFKPQHVFHKYETWERIQLPHHPLLRVRFTGFQRWIV